MYDTTRLQIKLNLSHCSRHSWWMNLMLPVQMQGWKRGLSGVPSHLQTRQISDKNTAVNLTENIPVILTSNLRLLHSESLSIRLVASCQDIEFKYHMFTGRYNFPLDYRIILRNGSGCKAQQSLYYSSN